MTRLSSRPLAVCQRVVPTRDWGESPPCYILPPVIPFEDAAAAFHQAYGRAPVVFACAPGRINLIGEHIDYAGGCVLPVALEYGVSVAAGPGQPGRMRVHSGEFLDMGVVEFDPNQPPPPAFTAFVHALALQTRATGADIAVVADLPPGRGLSSSAAFAVAVSAALLALEPGLHRPTPLMLCQLCQRAETKALGVACGLMDQYAALYGRRDSALLLDTHALTHECVPLLLPQAELVLVESGQSRRLAEAGYNERRDELSRALDALRERLGGFTTFRDVEPERLLLEARQLPQKLQRRVRHVVTEQQRVERFVAELSLGAVVELGRLLSASQASLSDDYGVSTPELDSLCELLDAQAGVYGARLVGGGFGGGVLALVHQQALDDQVVRALAQYEERYDLHAAHEVVVPGDAAQVQPADAPAPLLLADWLAGQG